MSGLRCAALVSLFPLPLSFRCALCSCEVHRSALGKEGRAWCRLVLFPFSHGAFVVLPGVLDFGMLVMSGNTFGFSRIPPLWPFGYFFSQTFVGPLKYVLSFSRWATLFVFLSVAVQRCKKFRGQLRFSSVFTRISQASAV